MALFFSSSLSSFLDLHATIVATYMITTFFITSLSYCVISFYGKEAVKDSVFIILGSLGLIALCVWFFGESNILCAAATGILTGEVLGLLLYEIFGRLFKQKV